MLVREAMTTPVVTVSPDTTLRQAATLLAEHRITSMPVVDGGRLVGVVSEADVVREALIPDQRSHVLHVPVGHGPDARYVSEVMTTMPLTVRPDTDLAQAAQTMTDAVVKSLPVVDRDEVIGIVSRTDVVAQLARRDQRVRVEVAELFTSEEVDWLFEVEDGVVTVEGPATEHEQRLAEVLAASVHGVVGVRFA